MLRLRKVGMTAAGNKILGLRQGRKKAVSERGRVLEDRSAVRT